jgi:hypothetical protein
MDRIIILPLDTTLANFKCGGILPVILVIFRIKNRIKSSGLYLNVVHLHRLKDFLQRELTNSQTWRAK